jgi:hypothetical protein
MVFVPFEMVYIPTKGFGRYLNECHAFFIRKSGRLKELLPTDLHGTTRIESRLDEHTRSVL